MYPHQIRCDNYKREPRKHCRSKGFYYESVLVSSVLLQKEMFLIWYFLQMQMLQPHKVNINIKNNITEK